MTFLLVQTAIGIYVGASLILLLSGLDAPALAWLAAVSRPIRSARSSAARRSRVARGRCAVPGDSRSF